MEEVKIDQPEVKPKPKLHIWNQILEDDELSEKLAASMNKLGDEFSRRFIRKRKNKKNKKKKKGKKDSNISNDNTNGNNNANCNTNGKTTVQPKDLKSEVKNPNTSQLQSKSQQLKKPHQKWNNQRQGGLSKKKDRLSNRILTEQAESISKKLKEKRIDLIIRTIRFLGLDEAMKLCSEVLTIEDAGGLMTMNGTRRRTPGGIFFHLIRSSGRYDASIISKLFKEGENKEPVFKSRKKAKAPSSTTTPSTSDANVINKMKTSDNNCNSIGTIELIHPIEPITELTKLPDEPVSQQQEPEKLTQTINSVDLKESNAPVNDDDDVKMEEEDDDDDFENSNLVIDDEYDDTNDTENGNTIDPNSEQLIKYSFPDNSNCPDLNILCQSSAPSTINSESSATINQNVSMFTTNRISVDA